MEKEKQKQDVESKKSDPNTLVLTKPITNFGREIKELNFKELTGKDCRKFGMPFSFTAEGSFIINESKSAKLIEASAGLEDGGADKLTAGDFMRASLAMMNFFQ